MNDFFQITKGNQQLLDVADKHKNDILLLDFYADWCGPCKAISPLLIKMVETHNAQDTSKKVILCKINVEDEENDQLCQDYKIRAMPTFVWISNMKMIDRFEGANSKIVLEKTNNFATQSTTQN